MASDTFIEENEVLFGGRVAVVTPETGCLQCQGVLDQNEVQEDLAGEAQLKDREAIYGVPMEALRGGGPSVVTMNGAVASLGVTELMVLLTGLRRPIAHLDYRGHEGVLRRVTDREPDCYYCALWPSGES